jgi:hypothetical protein
MIHLSTLSAALLRSAAEETVATPLEPSAEGDGAPVYGPPYEPHPSLPNQDDINRQLKALRQRQVGGAQDASLASSLPASGGAGSASPFAKLSQLFQISALNPQPRPSAYPTHLIAGMPGDPCSPVALNPQPLPPVDQKVVVAGTPRFPDDPIGPVALNPQPLPPRETLLARTAKITDPLAAVGLNPQPLPPREAMLARPSKLTDRLTAVGLNPQPLPPRERPALINDPLVAAGLNPQPLPPRADSLQDISKPFVRLGYLPPFAE